MYQTLGVELYRDILFHCHGKNVDFRHDVDFMLDCCLDTARHEYDYGVRAVYYIRLSSSYYNPLSKSGINLLSELRDMGHKIGLHFDITSYPIYNARDLHHYIRREANAFREFGFDIDSFTFHVNSDTTNQYTAPYYGALKNMNVLDRPYISDSRGMFKENVLEFIQRNDKFTILTHPEWWFIDGTTSEKIDKLMSMRNRVLTTKLNREIVQ